MGIQNGNRELSDFSLSTNVELSVIQRVSLYLLFLFIPLIVIFQFYPITVQLLPLYIYPLTSVGTVCIRPTVLQPYEKYRT